MIKASFVPRSSMLLFAILLVALFVMPASAQPGEGRGIGINPSGNIKQLPTKAKRFAIVIGVDRYDDTQITTLGGSVNDAKTLANALVQYAGFPAEQVTLLASDQPPERQPTRGNILRRLSNLSAVLAEGRAPAHFVRGPRHRAQRAGFSVAVGCAGQQRR